MSMIWLMVKMITRGWETDRQSHDSYHRGLDVIVIVIRIGQHPKRHRDCRPGRGWEMGIGNRESGIMDKQGKGILVTTHNS